MPEFTSSLGLAYGGFVRQLLLLLGSLGFRDPTYHGAETVRQERECWVVRVTIFPEGQPFVHQPLCYTTTRVNCSDAIQDVSRLALHRVCSRFSRELRRTPFRYFPARLPSERFGHAPSAEGESDATIYHLAELVKSLDDAYTITRRELYTAYETNRRMEQVRKENRELKKRDSHHLLEKAILRKRIRQLERAEERRRGAVPTAAAASSSETPTHPPVQKKDVGTSTDPVSEDSVYYPLCSFRLTPGDLRLHLGPSGIIPPPPTIVELPPSPLATLSPPPGWTFAQPIDEDEEEEEPEEVVFESDYEQT